MRDEGDQSMVCCDACGTAVPGYDIVNYGSFEQGYESFATAASTPRWPALRVWSTSRMSVSIRLC
jgi:hypothetical protein